MQPKTLSAPNSQNPRRILTDMWPIAGRLGKANIKNFGGDDRQEIVKGVFLGAVPKGVLDANTIRASALTEEEDKEIFKITEPTPPFRRPLWDHGVIDPVTGNNISVANLKEDLVKLYNRANNENKNVSFHCMAGKSRSQILTIGYLLWNPPLLQSIADTEWNNLSKKSQKRIGSQGNFNALVTRLKSDHPLPTDIAMYIGLRRPAAKKVEKMDGDQAGFLGLMALDQAANNLPRPPREQNTITTESAKRVAQNIGLMLLSPLDYGLRDQTDRKNQEDQFARVYETYKKISDGSGVDLLREMVVPPGKQSRGSFAQDFAALPPKAQARFAILAQNLVNQNLVNHNLLTAADFQRKFSITPVELAKQAVKKALSAGDKIELLRTFGKDCGLKFTDIAKNIPPSKAKQILADIAGVLGLVIKPLKKFAENVRMDIHNAGIQLAELQHIAQKQSNNQESNQAYQDRLDSQSAITQRINLLSPQEQRAYHSQCTTISNREPNTGEANHALEAATARFGATLSPVAPSHQLQSGSAPKPSPGNAAPTMAHK